MAIKTFTSGEVLTAADTNTYLANSGLVYVSTTTLTASGQNIAGAFSSTYTNYRIVLNNIVTSANNTLVAFRLGSSTARTEYIYGSAEVVGLMCLKVFCDGQDAAYLALKPAAQSLGAAFQKVNFLRDMKSDAEDRGRIYFPHLNLNAFNEDTKMAIIEDVKQDFRAAYIGIKQLPLSCRFGVYTSYKYYLRLLEKIEKANHQEVLKSRIRVPNTEKMEVLARAFVRFTFNAL